MLETFLSGFGKALYYYHSAPWVYRLLSCIIILLAFRKRWLSTQRSGGFADDHKTCKHAEAPTFILSSPKLLCAIPMDDVPDKPSFHRRIADFLSTSDVAASPDSPPSRPSSALSGGSSFINDTDDEDDDTDADSFADHSYTKIGARARAKTLARDGSKCILCGSVVDCVVMRLTGVENDGDKEASGTIFDSNFFLTVL